MPDSVKRRIVDWLIDGINRGTWKIGDRVPSYKAAAATFGASLAPVRDAYRHLEDRGVLQGQSGRGVYVLRAPAADDALPGSVPARVAALEQLAEERVPKLVRLEEGLTAVEADRRMWRERIVRLEDRVDAIEERLDDTDRVEGDG